MLLTPQLTSTASISNWGCVVRMIVGMIGAVCECFCSYVILDSKLDPHLKKRYILYASSREESIIYKRSKAQIPTALITIAINSVVARDTLSAALNSRLRICVDRYFCTNTLRALIAAWLDASQRSRNGVRLSRPVRE